MRDRLKPLYELRGFETVDALSAEYKKKANEYRDRILAKGAPEYTVEYDGKSKFDGGLLQRFGWNLLGNLVTILSLGFALPATVCWKMRWQVKHTVYNGKRLSFDGNGAQLMGKWVCRLLLTFVTLGIYGFFLSAKLEAWKAKHTHIAGECAALGGTFDGNPFKKIFLGLGCGIVTVFSLGLAYTHMQCVKERFMYKHRVYDGNRLVFNGNGAQLFGTYIKWWLLSIVTLSVYRLWIPIKLLEWKAKHTEIPKEKEAVL